MRTATTYQVSFVLQLEPSLSSSSCQAHSYIGHLAPFLVDGHKIWPKKRFRDRLPFKLILCDFHFCWALRTCNRALEK